MNKSKKLRLTLIRSLNRRIQSHIACVRGLGLRRMHQSVEVEDNVFTRGMINKVNYLLKVEEI